jgi:hypothetical protein
MKVPLRNRRVRHVVIGSHKSGYLLVNEKGLSIGYGTLHKMDIFWIFDSPQVKEKKSSFERGDTCLS